MCLNLLLKSHRSSGLALFSIYPHLRDSFLQTIYWRFFISKEVRTSQVALLLPAPIPDDNLFPRFQGILLG